MQLTKATLEDIPQMLSLVAEEVKSGVILDRSADEIATNIRSYILAKSEGRLVGYVALHVHSARLSEVRSLIVDETFRGHAVGKNMVLKALQEARELGLKEVLVLTYVPQFFLKLGFEEISKEQVPEQKIWADCIKCIHFPVCNEVSLMYRIDHRG